MDAKQKEATNAALKWQNELAEANAKINQLIKKGKSQSLAYLKFMITFLRFFSSFFNFILCNFSVRMHKHFFF